MKKNFIKVVSIVLTMLMLVGTMSALVSFTASAADAQYPIYLEKNKTATINGITYRFDSDPAINPDSWARVNADGTWELSYRSGDVLWFPGVELTDDSVIRQDVTNTSGGSQSKVVSGLVYAVVPNSNGRADHMYSAYTHTAGRFRSSHATYSGISTPVAGDGFNGNGGDKDKYTLYDKEYVSSWQDNKDWKNVIDGNKDLAAGKTVSYNVSKSADGNITATYCAHNTNLVSKTFTPSCSGHSYAGGSVGFAAFYSYDSSYGQTRIDELYVKNCKVNGKSVKGFSLHGEVLEAHKDIEVDGKVYRFDPLDSSALSYAVLTPNNTFRVTLQSGDLFWMPGTQDIDGIFASVKMISNNDQYNNNNIAAGIAYNIELGENGVWGDDDDSLINAHTQTSWRRRICATTVAQRDVSCTKLGVQSTNTMETANRNDAYVAWGDRWSCGSVLNYSVAINEAGNCYASFMDENNVEMTYDYYAIDESAGKVFEGPVGFYSYWSGDNQERGYMTVEILELTAIKEEVPVYGVTDAAVSLSLDGTIGLNFAFGADAGVPAGAKVVATKNGEKVVEKDVVDGENLVTVPVNAKEMKDTVNFSIMVDGQVFENHSYTTSVAEYAALILADDQYNEWDELINAMLTYGAAAQKYFNYKANDLAGDLSTLDYDLTAIAPITFTGDTSILKGLYVNLALEAETTLKLYFMPADGVKPTVTVNSEAVEVADNGDGYYVVILDGIAADDLADDFAIVVNGELSFACSAFDWARVAANDANADVVTLAKALAAYGEAASKKA